MGPDSTSHRPHEGLTGDGKEINIPLVTQLSGPGVGAGTLRGNEESIDSYGFPVWADWARNAVANNRAVNKESSFSIRSTARALLSGWSSASCVTIWWTRSCRSRPPRSGRAPDFDPATG
jgi:hypothetical protein